LSITYQDQINSLDAAYQRLSGHRFKASGLLTGREYAWSQFLDAGYTLKEIEETVTHIRRGVQCGKRHEAALGFRRLISDLGTFEDEACLADAEKRNAKPALPPKERVVQQARPVARPEAADAGRPAVSVGELIARLREAAR